MILIALEGLDNMGKTTLAKALHEEMLKNDSFCRWIYLTKEPGLATVGPGQVAFNRSGVDLRSIALTTPSLSPLERELLLYVDASQHARFQKSQGDAIILSDRGKWTHLAYVRGLLKTKKIDYGTYLTCFDLIHRTSAKPHAVIYLRGSVSLMRSRSETKEKDQIEKLGDDYFHAVAETFDDLANTASNVLVLNASNSTSKNVESVLSFLKGAFHADDLKEGTLNLSRPEALLGS